MPKEHILGGRGGVLSPFCLSEGQGVIFLGGKMMSPWEMPGFTGAPCPGPRDGAGLLSPLQVGLRRPLGQQLGEARPRPLFS